jgi:hypothetical protein
MVKEILKEQDKDFAVSETSLFIQLLKDLIEIIQIQYLQEKSLIS